MAFSIPRYILFIYFLSQYEMLIDLLLLDEWTINNLSIKMRVPATTLRRRIGYWQNQVYIFIVIDVNQFLFNII